ncbi:MAG: magnesium and cobalt transport protein CorA, partial [archaeon]
MAKNAHSSIPGTVIYSGRKKTGKVKIQVIDYNESNYVEKELKSVKEIVPFKNNKNVTWINITGIHDTKLI